MSPDLPFDIIALIVDIVGENEETDLLKKLALISHSLNEICSKHLFAIVDLYSARPFFPSSSSSKRGFVKLLKSRPEVVKYIRKLKYNVTDNDDDDDLLSPILSNFLPTFSCLHSLTITASRREWNELNPSLTSAFLFLMRLPTINHISLSYIQKFPLSSLIQSVNLLRLDIHHLCYYNRLGFYGIREKVSPEIVEGMMPKIRQIYTSGSSRLTTKLLHAKMRDGRPAFNFMDLRQFSISFQEFDDGQNIQYLLHNAKLLENFRLSVECGRKIVGLLSNSPSARTLKVLDLSVSLWYPSANGSVILGGTCEELEALAGHNMLKAFKIRVDINSNDSISEEGFIGSAFKKMENALVKPGWSALRRVSFEVPITGRNCKMLCEALQSLPHKYLNRLSNLESVTFKYQAYLPDYPNWHFDPPSVEC